MTSPEVELRRMWHRVAGHTHDDVIERLLARHREPHRRYHTAMHVMWVCRHVDRLIADHQALGQPVGDPDAVRVAALFHDAIYDPRSATNEADSATLADGCLTEIGWSPDRRALVRRLVELTAGHQLDESAGSDRSDLFDLFDLAGGVLLDADLAVLGSPANEYQHYATAVRAEYSHVDDDAWRVGRARVLQQFLDRRAIFVTSAMRAEREHCARANLTAELTTLR